jgi:predicted P-loop ATPase
MINLFKNVFDHNTDKQIQSEDFFNNIKYGFWKEYKEKFQKEKNLDKRKNIKINAPAVTISGVFDKKRQATSLLKHSGLICIDIDSIADDEMESTINILQGNEYTHCLFKTMSDKGLAWIVKIDPAKHKESFEALQALVFSLTGYPADPVSCNVNSTRTISYDPNLFFNANSKIFKQYIKKESVKQYKQRIDFPQSDNIDSLIQKIHSDITGSYHEWIRIGFAIASKYGEGGEHYFHSLSRFNNNYDEVKTSRQYKYCCRNYQGSSINIGTLFYYAKQHGYELYDPREKEIIKHAIRAKKGHRDISSAKNTLSLSNIQIESNTDESLLNNAFNNTSDFEKIIPKEEVKEKLDINELENYITQNWNITKNVLNNFYYIDDKRMDREALNSIFISCKKAFPMLQKDIFQCLIYSDFVKSINPVTDYLNTLTWDGIDRIHSLAESLNSCTGDLTYQKTLLSRWLMGFMQNVFSDNACPLFLLLVGTKNSGKTYFFEHLLPKILKPYFGTSQLDKEKDDDLLMTQKLLILDDEYSGKSKQEARKMKRLLSTSNFDLRPPYGSENIQLKRLAVLAGTCNELEVLNDPTGNRRFIVFEIQKQNTMNWNLFNSIDKDQLFAQLKTLWNKGYTGNLTREEIQQLEELTDAKHSETSLEKELLEKYFKPIQEETDGLTPDGLTNSEIKILLEKETNQKLSTKKLGMELTKLGFIQKVVKDRKTKFTKRLWLIQANKAEFVNTEKPKSSCF